MASVSGWPYAGCSRAAYTGPGDTQMELTPEQARALVIGLPWQRLGEYKSITVL